MKKLMILALLTVGVSAFAIEGSATPATLEGRSAVTQTTVSLGDSFMAAFGMGDTNVSNGASEGHGTEGGNSANGNNTSSSTTVSVPAGVVSSAINTATTITNNSTTIVTPYGKY